MPITPISEVQSVKEIDRRIRLVNEEAVRLWKQIIDLEELERQLQERRNQLNELIATPIEDIPF
jgi:hypothetical protein